MRQAAPSIDRVRLRARPRFLSSAAGFRTQPSVGGLTGLRKVHEMDQMGRRVGSAFAKSGEPIESEACDSHEISFRPDGSWP